MNNILLFLASAFALYSMNAGASYYVSSDTSPYAPPPYIPPPDPATVDEALTEIYMEPDANTRVMAFLAMIKEFESRNDYYVLYGGGHFSDTSAHPNVRVPFYNPRKAGAPGVPNDYSTAAGAYQINKPTYDTYIDRLGGPSVGFSPEVQDWLAYIILNSTGADISIANNDLATALRLASRKWASLPGSTALQNPQTYQTAWDTYNQYLTDQG